ncbi:hypothetical protein ScPMuIL_004569 [Solemya velum]
MRGSKKTSVSLTEMDICENEMNNKNSKRKHKRKNSTTDVSRCSEEVSVVTEDGDLGEEHVLKNRKRNKNSEIVNPTNSSVDQPSNTILESPKKKRKKGPISDINIATPQDVLKEKHTSEIEDTVVNCEKVSSVMNRKSESHKKKKRKHKSSMGLENSDATDTLEAEGDSTSDDKMHVVGASITEDMNEEQALLDAKKKKKEKKKKKAEEKKNKKELDEKKESAKTPALEYLKQWKSDRKNWKFQKVRQVWVLQHMYDDAQITDDNFEIVLEYLEGLKGQSKDMTVKKAEEMLPDDIDEDDVRYKRARQVIQLLT